MTWGFPDGTNGKKKKQKKKTHLSMQETKSCKFDPGVKKIPWKRA